MTFREKIAQAVAEKLFHNGTGIFTASTATLVITKYKKEAEALLREIRDGGALFGEILDYAIPRADHDHNREGTLRHRLSNAYVSIGDLKVGLHSGSVYFFPEKDAETAMRIFLNGPGIPDVIVDDRCSMGAKFLSSEPSEDALKDLGSWIDSIPVV